MLLAAKYWEDYYFWNIDFSEALKIYPIDATNRLESLFLTLCDYELFVSESLYDKYYKHVHAKKDQSRRTSVRLPGQ